MHAISFRKQYSWISGGRHYWDGDSGKLQLVMKRRHDQTSNKTTQLLLAVNA